jgi:hypothetical protein
MNEQFGCDFDKRDDSSPEVHFVHQKTKVLYAFCCGIDDFIEEIIGDDAGNEK